ncbi:MAG TPA: hypothetical protein VLA12_00750 [Planctomycetaceae bacterium]|nr:hypothetical protein [Planctomycetaceae bacterium]
MIVVDDAIVHTGTNTDAKLTIPLSKFRVSCRKKNNDPEGEPMDFDAVDETDAIAQYIRKNSIKHFETSGRKFKAEPILENRSDIISPPEPKAVALGSQRKGEAPAPVAVEAKDDSKSTKGKK